MVKKHDLTYDSRDGISKIYAAKWVPESFPDGSPVAVLQIVHGMAEYIDRYDDFARYMAEHGLVVTGNDHLGHGKSLTADHPKGYFCENDAATVVVRDVHRLKKKVQEEYPGVPYLILGHSMGSFIVRDYLTRYGTGVQGAIIQGTGYQPAALAKAGMAVASMQRLLTGDKHPSMLLNGIAFGGFLKNIHPLRTKMDWLSYNAKNVDDYIADPLLGFTFTVNGFRTLFELILRSGDVERMELIPKNLPIILSAGEEDPVGDNSAAVKKLYGIYRDTLHMTDVTLKLYPHMRHEILMEDEKEKVYEEYLRWIGEHWKDM